jgi:hypothetical protein
LSVGRRYHTATLLVSGPLSGQVLVTGGDAAPAGPFATAELYNPSTQTWSPAAPMHIGREGHTATLLNDGTVLVTGGFPTGPVGTPPLASAERYDASSGVWSLAGSMSVGRSGDTATLNDGFVLVAGGSDLSGTPLSAVDQYSLTTSTWSSTTPLNTARVNHTATLLNDGQVLVAGGLAVDFTYTSSAELYLPCLCSDGTACPNDQPSLCPGQPFCNAPETPCPCSGGPQDGVCICLSTASQCARFCAGKGGSGPSCSFN